MSFKIQELKKPKIETAITKKVSHEGLELTLTIRQDNDFFTALSRVQGLVDGEKNIKNALKRGQMASHEALLFVIGEYAIDEWNVTDMDDKPIEINGDNLILVIESVPDLQDFLVKLIDEFNTALGEFSTAVENLKKKSLNTTSGKTKSKN